ncbi:MAG: hypothetical protein RMJ37_08235, partial [Spirochaetia bacterium]|nr:hypothetical protein [Spirochaetota bacterium]MDW8113303.1 hypothetical protein [Spirochaetia bacterium]
VVLSNWKLEDSRAKLSFVSNDSDGLPLYKIVLANDLTNNITLNFKFVNGTPGEPSSWALVEKSASGGEINDRSAAVQAGQDVFIYHTNTNTVSGNNVDVHPNGIQSWASVGPSYLVTNINAYIIVSNIATNKGSEGIGSFAISGSFNGWPGTPDPDNPKIDYLLTNANGVTIKFWISNYYGSASVAFKVRGSNIAN